MRDLMNLFEQSEDAFRFLYHVSARIKIKSIKEHGLDPRFSRGTKAVYLASDELHALGYVDHHGQNGDIILLRIDLSKLNSDLLGPDDADLPDMLEYPDGDEDENGEYQKGWADYSWIDSLNMCGQCCYHGIIPPSAITVKIDDEYQSF